MEAYGLISYAAPLLVTLAFFHFARYLCRTTTKLNLPPGPKPCP
ncbi:hypothetical protein Tco_1088490, partial [Tanacetum coccineum]